MKTKFIPKEENARFLDDHLYDRVEDIKKCGTVWNLVEADSVQ
jgi:hypothetical protein